MTNEEIVKHLQNGASKPYYMGILWGRVQRMAYILANKYSYAAAAEVDDLIQLAYIGLDKAAKKYEEDKGASFSTYAYKWMSAAVRRYAAKNKADLISLDSLIDEETGATLYDITPSGESTENKAIEKVDNEHLKAVLWEEVENLGDDGTGIIKGVYKDDKTRQALSNELGVPLHTVIRLEKKSLVRLKKGKALTRLKPYIKDYIQAKGIRRSGLTAFKYRGVSSTEDIAIKLYSEVLNEY